MSGVETFNALLKTFGMQVGINDLSFNEDLHCRFTVDGQLSIDVRYDKEKEIFSLLSEIGQLSENNFEISCDCLLKANSEWALSKGMTLGKIPNTRTVTLGYYEPSKGLLQDRFDNLIRGFVEFSEAWKKQLELISQGQLPKELSDL